MRFLSLIAIILELSVKVPPVMPSAIITAAVPPSTVIG
jgi:hypothetical protein